MIRSLRARFLAATMAVAVVSVAATAWLTTRDGGEQLRSSVANTFDADGEIYDRLLRYALTHPDWNDVDGLVEDLAADTGRRIALTTAGGEIIADSAPMLGHGDVPLPERPAFVIDAFEPVIVNIDPDDLIDPSPVYELTPEEVRQREQWLDEGLVCLQARGFEADVDRDRYGPSVQVAQDDDMSEEELAAGDLAVDACFDDRLSTPGAAEAVDQREQTRREGECLTAAGVPYTVSTDGMGGTAIEVTDEHFDDDMRCVTDASRVVLDRYFADTAQLYLGEPDGTGIALVGPGSRRTLVVAGAVVLLALAASLLISRRVLRPVVALTAAAQRMEAGDRSQRVDDSGGDELARLAHAFNAMADGLAAHEEQRRRLASDVAHELRTPLTNLRGYVEAAQDGLTPTDPALLASLHEEAVLLQRLVDDMQTLSLAEAGRLPLAAVPLDLAALAEQVVGAFRLTAEVAGVALAGPAERPGLPPVDADPVRLRQVLANLVANALRHTPPGGQVTVRAALAGDGHGDVALTVADTGEGIAARHLPHVFERFWRADSSRTRDTGGSGLGLAICRQLVDLHGGSLAVESTFGEGSTFTIRLPPSTHQP